MVSIDIFRKCFRFHNIFKNQIIPNRCYCSNVITEKPDKSWPKRFFSGIQPTGSIHIGNYFGAVKKWVELQDTDGNVMVSVVDLHSITLPQNPENLKSNIIEATATLLACGIDPDKTILFLQSSVPQHAELSWILGCISTMTRLAHLPQFKEKSETMKDIPLGLYIYPVLQAADILLYKSTHVPVGEDQLQHLQMAQQIAKTFNFKFGVTFPSPLPIHGGENAVRLKSLRDPSKKMSKSDPTPKSRIHLTDTSDDIVKKIRKSVTDFNPEISYDPVSRPGVSNLINIHCLATNKIPEEVCEESEGLNTLMYKSVVSDTLCEVIKPIREKIEYHLKYPDYMIDVLLNGSSKAKEIADITIQEVYDKVGLGIPNRKSAHVLKKCQKL